MSRPVAALTAALMVLCLGFVQALAERRRVRWDLTEERLFTLSEPTLATLREVRAPVTVLGFLPSGDLRRTHVEGLLREVALRNPLVGWRLVDPELEPDLARRHRVTRTGGAVLVGSGRAVEARGLNEFHLVSGLRRLLGTTAGRVLFLLGHGERDLMAVDADGARMFAEALEASGLRVDPLKLAGGAAVEVPADAACVVALGPRSDLLPEEALALQAFLDRGGGLLLAAEEVPGTGWQGLLDRWGLGLARARVVDPVSNSRGNPESPLTEEFRAHPIVRPLTSVALAGARPIVVRRVEGVRTTPLVLTGATSWGETSDALALDPAEDLPPPLTVAVACERSLGVRDGGLERLARVVFLADADVLARGSFAQRSNADLGLATVEWLAGQQENVVLLPREFLVREVYLTPGQFRVLAALALGGMPALWLACAAWLWRKRR